MPMGRKTRLRKEQRRREWNLLGIVTTMIPNPFPPFRPPEIPQKEFGVKASLQGIWIPAQQDISTQMFQAGRGIFACDKEHVDNEGNRIRLLLNDTLEDPERGIVIKLISDELQSDAETTVQIQRWVAEVYSRSKAEADAERFRSSELDPHIIGGTL